MDIKLTRALRNKGAPHGALLKLSKSSARSSARSSAEALYEALRTEALH